MSNSIILTPMSDFEPLRGLFERRMNRGRPTTNTDDFDHVNKRYVFRFSPRKVIPDDFTQWDGSRMNDSPNLSVGEFPCSIFNITTQQL